VLKLTYGNVKLKKCFGGITPEPPFQVRDRSGRRPDGTGRKGRGGQRRGGEWGAGWVMGLSPPQSQIPGYVPVRLASRPSHTPANIRTLEKI